MQTSQLMTLLRERYPKDAYAFFTEVPNGTGGNCRRHCDALIQSLWPSRGLHLTGFELKVSRADWIKEMKQPEKADSIARYCDFWYLVVGDEKIVQPGELPPTWGLMMPVNGKLKVKTEASKLEPLALSHSFIAGLFRAAQSQITKDAELAKIKHEEFQRGYAKGRESRDVEIDSIKKAIAEFEQKAGVKLDRYNVGTLAEAVQMIQSGELTNAKWHMAQIRKSALRVIEALDFKESENAVIN